MTNNQKTILITGTSSGIGKTTALYLAQLQYTVLATVRKEEDARMLNDYHLQNLIPICPLDLTKSEELENASQKIVAKLTSGEIPPLYGVIFNAGGGKIVPIELMTIEDFRDEIEKRVIGSVFLLQRMLPFIRISKGRILWIATPALLPTAFIADIHTPDFAVNFLARTLNIELRPDEIRNILIRCGGIDTPSPKKGETDIVGKLSDIDKDKIDIYRERLVRFEKNLKIFSKRRIDPILVSMTIAEALSARKPKTRYQIGYMSKVAAFFETMPQSWIDYLLEKRTLKNK